MHNDIRGEKKSTNRTGGNTRDLRSRLVGKNGRVRNTLMGKRVNYSARDVITPSIFLAVDEVYFFIHLHIYYIYIILYIYYIYRLESHNALQIHWLSPRR